MQILSTCECCEGLTVEVPVLLDNLPGLDAIAYRVGTQPTFKQSLLARLTTAGKPALQGLTTRDDSDFTIALLDAWSVVADVLTFYQERIANEAFLRTATERLSILELARLVGYELAPGVAANTWIAFTLNNNPGALGPVLPVSATPNAVVALPPVTIPAGTAIKSIPGPGQTAQTYETQTAIVAHPEWNAIPVRTSIPQVLDQEATFLIVNGISTGVSKGDVVMIYTKSSGKLRKVAQVTIDKKLKTTRLDLVPDSTKAAPLPPVAYQRQIFTSGVIDLVARNTPLEAATVQTIQRTSWNAGNFSALIGLQNWSHQDLVLALSAVGPRVPPPPPVPDQLVVFKKRAAVFGYNAPQQYTPASPPTYAEWTLVNEAQGQLWLDSNYPEVVASGFIAVQPPGTALENSYVISVGQADSLPRTDYGVSAKSTLVTYNTSTTAWAQPVNGMSLGLIRGITVYAQSEALVLAPLPIPDFLPPGSTGTNDILGNQIILDGLYNGLVPTQNMVLNGNRTDLPGTSASELVVLADVEVDVDVDNAYTVLTLLDPLANTYQRSTVTLNGNIAVATNGATVSEVLGSGDATQVFQSFTLKQSPLTYTASTDAGGASSLVVRVNDLLWTEVPFFFGHGPMETIFVTRRDNSGSTNVIFGDGATGARLPTGQSNIKATYRVGTGQAGMVNANQLSQLTSAPTGVKSAVNPLAPTGAEDPENIDDARQNATVTILALDRVVSLQDYSDYARTFGGIAKALATWTWDGFQRCVYLTVAAPEGKPLDPNGQTITDLAKSIPEYGDPNVPLSVVPFDPVLFQVTGTITMDPIYLPADVSAAVEKALRSYFSFANRSFGQCVAYSEVVAVIQDVAGVVAVNVTNLFITGSDANAPLPNLLRALVPQPGTGTANAFPAQLLTLDPQPLGLTIPSA